MSARLRFVGGGYAVECQTCNWHRAESSQQQAEIERLRHNRERHTKGNR